MNYLSYLKETLAGLLFFLVLTLSSQTYYVDPDGGSTDGLSWGNAFNTIEAALAVASDGSQIWIANGNYAPSSQLVVPGGVQMYGGFEGVSGAQENSISQRNWLINQVIIDGAGISPSTMLISNSVAQVTVDGVYLLNGVTDSNAFDIDKFRFGCENEPSSF